MEKILFSEIKNTFSNKIDLFICSSSFEERCSSIISNIDKLIIGHVSICHYSDNYDISVINKEKIEKKCEDNKIKYSEINFCYNDPIANCDQFIHVIRTFPRKSKILIDISTFTRENIFILIKLSKSVLSDYVFSFCYTPSNKYSNSEEIHNIWLSKGVGEIRSVLGFSGEFSPLKKLLLITLIGFEYERTQTLINSYEPNVLILGKASEEESINATLSEINNKHLEHLKSLYPEADSFEFSCKNINFTKKELSKLILKYQDEYNIVISPMNNKISTVAVASIANEFPNIQICYATTNQYNTDCYSNACDYFYHFSSEEI